VERALDVDEGQMIARIIKKIAAGSTHVVIDIPIGKTAKVRTEQDAEKLKYYFNVVGKAVGIKVNVLFTDGSQPIGRGIGPALEAMDVLSVLRNEMEAPKDLRNKALLLPRALLTWYMVQKVDYSLQRKFFHQEKIEVP
jgi:thymidine phosphorylase